MNRVLVYFLLGLLVASIGINGYLWLRLEKVNQNAINHESAYQQRLTGDSSGVLQPNGGHSSTQGARYNDDVPYSDENIANAVRDLRKMLEAGHYDKLAEQLNRYLKDAPNNEALLLIEAELIKLTQPLSTALIHYYDLADSSLSTSARNNVNAEISTLYQQAQRQLRQAQQWELVAQLNEALYQRVPDEHAYILNLAEAYAHQQKLTLMEDVLAALPFNHSKAQAIRGFAYQEEASSIVDNPANPSSLRENSESAITAEGYVREVYVPLRRYGDQYRVDAITLDEDADMILDTGATISAISYSLFRRMGGYRTLPFVGNFQVYTASGSIEAALVKIPLFKFAGYEISNVSAIVLPEDALPESDGLLGMNILGKFDFSILPQENQLLLQERKKPLNAD